LDAGATWLSDGGNPNLNVLLSIWNLAGDVARSVEKPFEDRGGDLDAIYNKVFFGNNLPAMTPLGEHYEPDWDDEELALTPPHHRSGGRSRSLLGGCPLLTLASGAASGLLPGD
jgi:hypothetical protein